MITAPRARQELQEKATKKIEDAVQVKRNTTRRKPEDLAVLLKQEEAKASAKLEDVEAQARGQDGRRERRRVSWPSSCWRRLSAKKKYGDTFDAQTKVVKGEQRAVKPDAIAKLEEEAAKAKESWPSASRPEDEARLRQKFRDENSYGRGQTDGSMQEPVRIVDARTAAFDFFSGTARARRCARELATCGWSAGSTDETGPREGGSAMRQGLHLSRWALKIVSDEVYALCRDQDRQAPDRISPTTADGGISSQCFNNVTGK